MNNPAAYFADLADVLRNVDITSLITIANLIHEKSSEGGIVFVVGNGGSAANASHLVLHLREVGITAVDLLSDLPYLTAMANDYSYADAPAMRLASEAAEVDLLLVISGSGNSDNVLGCLSVAESEGMTSVGLLGFGGGRAQSQCNHFLTLASDNYGLVEDTHSAIIHVLKNLLTPQENSNGHYPV